MKFNNEMITIGAYIVIIALLLVLVFKGPSVECVCSSAKSARAPFQRLPNPANMSTQETNANQQTLMNIKGCKQLGGIWEERPGGTGVCLSCGQRPGGICMQ